MEENSRLGKISDFPIADEYPYFDDMCDDIDENSMCIPRDKIEDGSVSIKCNIREMVGKNTYIIRDRKKFKKVYMDNIEVILGLSSTASKIMWYIIKELKLKSQYIEINIKACMDKSGFKTPKSVRDGVIELLNKNILYRTAYSNRYWLNPLVVFNGDRIEFVKEYIYKED